MKNNKLNIRYGSLFPWYFQLLGIVVGIGALASLITNPILGAVLLLISLFILTGYNGTIIDKENCTYREYNSFLFIKSGSIEKYDHAVKLYINQSNVSQKIYTAHTLNSRTFRNVEYNAYVMFDTGAKTQLLNHKNKETLTDRLKGISQFLDLEIIDNTIA